jgi:hypothetical protein
MFRIAIFLQILSCVFCASASAQLFEIARPIFSSGVSDDGDYVPLGPAIDGRVSRANLSRGLLYFSFTVIGGQPALEYLRQYRRLEVDAVILGERSERISGLGISQEKWSKNREAWISQFEKLGYFTFRTFMNTERIADDMLELQVRDGRSNVIKPVAYNSSTYKASIEIVP